MTQLVQSISLVADSPRKAFYNIWLEEYQGQYKVRKESGIKEIVLDRRVWNFESLETALKYFNRRVKEKTNPYRKSKRIYYINEL